VAAPAPSLNRVAASATTHCLTGCAIGEVLGLVIATALGWGVTASIALAVGLAFLFGYSLTLRPLLRAGLAFAAAAQLALAADTVSITVMEIVDNAVMVAIPGAMASGLDDPLFWGSLILSLAIAWLAAFPVNRWLISRGRGHAVVHAHHHAGAHAGHAGEHGSPGGSHAGHAGEHGGHGGSPAGHAGAHSGHGSARGRHHGHAHAGDERAQD
jgi:hypothetical protein